MRTLGTVVRGIRAPIFRAGDDAVAVTAETVLNALKANGIEPRDKDVVAVTESVVARCQGNYATVEQIAADVKRRTGGGTVGLTFPIVTLITAFSALFGTGGVPLFSMARGRRDENEAGAILGNALALLLIPLALWFFRRRAEKQRNREISLAVLVKNAQPAPAIDATPSENAPVEE